MHDKQKQALAKKLASNIMSEKEHNDFFELLNNATLEVEDKVTIDSRLVYTKLGPAKGRSSNTNRRNLNSRNLSSLNTIQNNLTQS